MRVEQGRAVPTEFENLGTDCGDRHLLPNLSAFRHYKRPDRFRQQGTKAPNPFCAERRGNGNEYAAGGEDLANSPDRLQRGKPNRSRSSLGKGSAVKNDKPVEPHTHVVAARPETGALSVPDAGEILGSGRVGTP